MRPIILLLSLAIGNSFGATVAPTPISFLPFPITNPGTYVLTQDMTFTNPALTDTASAITVATNISGPVIIDLKGHSLIGSGGFSIGVGIGTFAGSTSTTNQSITVRNGTIRGFGFGVWAEIGGVYLTNIGVRNITFFLSHTSAGNETCVLFSQVNSSSVSNCSFNVCENGISDEISQGGNQYANNTFTNVFQCLFVTGQNNGVPSVLNRCSFDGPPL
jgi:hypothetical protein